MKNCVWTAPARADRGSDPPEKLAKTPKNRSANQHTYKPYFHSKSTSKNSTPGSKNLEGGRETFEDANDYYFPEIIKPQMIIILVPNNSHLGSGELHFFSEIIDLHGPK